MTDVVIGDILPYTQAIAIAGQTVFGTNWTANYYTDVVVYLTPAGDPANDIAQVLTLSQYSVAFIGGLQQVQITLVTPAAAGDRITITRQTPAARMNLYTNTNFTPTMLNQDFGILTLVDQQAQLVDQKVGPRYNYSAVIDPLAINEDTILPVLPANHVWAKNVSNTAIVTVDLGTIISGGTVTEIDTGTGLTGGPITTAGTISFAPIAANSLWANVTGASAVPTVVPTSTFLISADNLSDVPNKAAARTNLGLEIGVNVEAWSPILDSIAALSGAANTIPFFAALDTYGTISAAASSVLATNGTSVPAMSQTLPTAVQANITQLGTQSQALNMGSHLINNVTDPVSLQDAATKNYVDTAGGAFLPLAGGTMSGVINMNSHKITNVTDPTSAQDAATKAYADLMLPLAGGTMSGIINMNTHKITNLTNPSAAADAANKAYVDATVGDYLPLAGGTMSGVIDMGNHKITNVTDPSASQDAVNLEYLNTQLALYLPLSGGTMTGVINMNSHKITNLTDPTNPQDAATKNYVDAVATGFSVQPAVYAATTGNLTATYLNGASGIGATLTNSGALAQFTTDGTTPPTNARILVWEQSSTLQNGIYTLTNQGSGAVAWILTRATDYDQPAEIQPGDLVVVNNGTLYAGTSFIETASVAAVGTDPILFSQFTFSASAVLLKANNLSDVANTTTSFNNISPLTTKGDLLGYNSGNVRVAVGGSDGQILRVKSAAATGWAWSTATYPDTTTVNQILYSSATNTVTGIATTAGGVLVTNSTNVPSFLSNPSASGRILQSVNGDASAWSTPTYPSASGTAGKIIISDGTNNVYSTPTYPNSATGTGTLLRADGTNWVATTTTYPNTNAINTLLYASAANVMSALATANDGILVTSHTGVPSILAGPGTTGNILQSNAAAPPSYSTATYPSTATGTGTILRADGTNWVATTTTYPNTNAINTLLYASSANVMSALATANSGVLVTSAGGVPSISTTLPSGLTIPGYAASGANNDITSMTDLTGYLQAPLGIKDSNGNIVIKTNSVASAVNYINITNRGTGSAPIYGVAGTDSSINLIISPKDGIVQILDSTSTIAGAIQFRNAANTHYTQIGVADAQSTDVTFKLPAADGSANAVMQTDGSGNLSLSTIVTSNTYTPTLTNTTNISSSTSAVFQYLRVGSVVTVSGVVNVTATAAGSINMGLSLPIASNFATATQCGGQFGAPSTTSYQAGQITGDTTNHRATCVGFANDTTARNWAVHFTYLIV